MNPFVDDEFGQRARPLRLATLIRLRSLAAAGQIVAILFAYFGLGVRFPLAAELACVAALIALNLWLRWRYPVSRRLDDDSATAIFAFDILQLAVLLLLGGGLSNPFSIFFLAPLATSAVSLPWRNTLILLALALACETALAFASLPLRGADGRLLTPPPLLGEGLWVAVGLGAVFVSIYGARVASEARQLASALNATELMLARAQHLAQLDGLAAAAAHELGTPLATVALVVHELAGQPEIAELCADDLKLAEEQVARCRRILGRLSSRGERQGLSLEVGGLGPLIEEVAAPHRLLGIAIVVELSGAGPEPSCRRNAAVTYGLSNLIENAVGFTASRVTIRASWTHAEVRIVVSDDGPGFPAQVLARLGEPYISDRAAARRGEGQPAGGLGLGLFIAKALLERSGARLAISNAPAGAPGAIATVVWPRSSFETDARPARPEAAEPASKAVGG